MARTLHPRHTGASPRRDRREGGARQGRRPFIAECRRCENRGTAPIPMNAGHERTDSWLPTGDNRQSVSSSCVG